MFSIMALPKNHKPALIIAGLFILSAASLGFEVSLTRIYSYLFVQSYVYIIISCSMAGLGFGAVLMYFLGGDLRKRVLGMLIPVPAVMLFLLLLINTGGTVLWASLAVTFIVFASIGTIQVHIFQSAGIAVSRLYAADLTGAAAGSLLSYLAMNGLGTLATIYLLIALMTAACFMVYTRFFGTGKYTIVAGAAAMVLIIVGYAGSLGQNMYPDSTWQKEMTVMLENRERNPEITETRWTAFGRVDVVENDNPYFKTMFIDGGAGTKMIRMEGGQVSGAVARSLLLEYMGGIPLLVVEDEDRNRAAVIGSGGGIDAVTLLLADYKHIDAVEINPEFIDIVREQKDYAGGIYSDHPRIDVHYDEGRSFLRNSDAPYDLILMGLPIIKSLRNFSNYALTENYLFTVEAFTEYINALEPGGFLVIISHYPNELRRLYANAVSALQNKHGISASLATQHMVSIGTDRNPTLVVKSGVISPKERSGFNTILTQLPVTGSTNFVPFSSAGLPEAPFNPDMVALSRGVITLDEFVRKADEDISPVTDDSPFFYQMSPGLPRELSTVGLVLLFAVALVVLLFFLRPLKTVAPELKSTTVLRFFSFGCIGLGFMLVEIGLLQKFIVFWHHQTLALSVVLTVILAAGGTGSLIAGKIRGRKAFLWTVLVIILIQTFAGFFLETALKGAEDLAAAAKFLLTLALAFPVFIFMGVPFPYLLRQAAGPEGETSLYPWMMGFNSLATLGGGVTAMILAMAFGYRLVIAAGILLYLALFVLTLAIRPIHRTADSGYSRVSHG